MSRSFVERECGVVEAGAGVDEDAEDRGESDCEESPLEKCPLMSVLQESGVMEESWSGNLVGNDPDFGRH